MTEQERQEFINQFWIKFNSLGPDMWEVKDEYEINTMTKQVRNILTGEQSHWIDTGNSTLGKRICLVKNNGKVSSYSQQKVNKLIRMRGR